MDWRGELPGGAGGGGNPFDQNLNTFDNPSFKGVTLTDPASTFTVYGPVDFKNNVLCEAKLNVNGVSTLQGNVYIGEQIDTVAAGPLLIGNVNATQISYGSGVGIQHYFNGDVNIPAGSLEIDGGTFTLNSNFGGTTQINLQATGAPTGYITTSAAGLMSFKDNTFTDRVLINLPTGNVTIPGSLTLGTAPYNMPLSVGNPNQLMAMPASGNQMVFVNAPRTLTLTFGGNMISNGLFLINHGIYNDTGGSGLDNTTQAVIPFQCQLRTISGIYAGFNVTSTSFQYSVYRNISTPIDSFQFSSVTPNSPQYVDLSSFNFVYNPGDRLAISFDGTVPSAVEFPAAGTYEVVLQEIV
jgi:hypothetical protein